MRVRLKGINSRTKVLKDGTNRTYWYAWKGGPRLEGKPGTAEFLASYNAAVARKVKPAHGTLLAVMNDYQASNDFRDLSESTRREYIRYIKVIESEFHDFPIEALTDRRTRGDFMAWRDRLGLKSRRGADYAWTVLARILSWGLDRGSVPVNPCVSGGRLYRANRRAKVWTTADESAFLAAAPTHMRLPLVIALWTGQRQGDLLSLPWAAYDGKRIRLRQSKTGAAIDIPVGAPLRAALDATERSGATILANSKGQPWTSDGFRTSWRKACEAAHVTGLTFHDLRGTAVTRLAVAGCTQPEIATITGHSLRDVGSILDSSYLNRDPAMADSAIRKLEAGASSPDRAPDQR